MNPTQALMELQVATRRELLRAGGTPQHLAAGVKSGALLRLRRGFYSLPSIDRHVEVAVRVGGLATCLSAARLFGIWAPKDAVTHVAMRHEASRMRSPRDRFEPLTTQNRESVKLHWWPLIAPDSGNHSVSVIDALRHVVQCQRREIAIAALDSALYQRKICEADIAEIFAGLPSGLGKMRSDIDASAMSGLETLGRLIARNAGFQVESQVYFRGIGTVDLVIDGCIVVETDGSEFHSGLAASARDYDRDAALAALGYTVLRFNYRQLMFLPERVLAAIRGARRVHRLP